MGFLQGKPDTRRPGDRASAGFRLCSDCRGGRRAPESREDSVAGVTIARRQTEWARATEQRRGCPYCEV